MVLTKIENLANVQRGQVAEWKNDILALATETGQAPKEIAEGMYFLASAGLKGKTALDALTASARASAIGMGETQVVADAVSSAINAYGASNLSAARATNVLALAVEAGKMEANSLAPVMGRVIPIAASLKIRFEDISGVMAAMSRTGMSSYQAATSLAQVMSDLLKPSNQANETLQQIGISMGEVRAMVAKPGGLLEALRLLEQRSKGLSDEALSRIFSDMRAFRGITNVLTQDMGEVDYVMGRVSSGIDLVGKGMERIAQEPGFQMKQMFAELMAIMIRIGDQIAPVFLAWVKSLGGVDGAAKSVNETLKTFTLTVGPALVAAVGVIGDTFYGWHMIIKGLEVAFYAWRFSVLTVVDAVAGAVVKAFNFMVESINAASQAVSRFTHIPIPEIKVRMTMDDLTQDIQGAKKGMEDAAKELDQLANKGAFSTRLTAQYEATVKGITAANKKVVDDTKETFQQKIPAVLSEYTDDTSKLVPEPGGIGGLRGGLRSFEDPLVEQSRVVAEEMQLANDRMNTLKELAQMEMDVTGRVSEEKIKLMEAYNERLKKLRMAEAQILIQSGQEMMDSLLTATEGFAGKQSDIYKGMFAASKAFAIAEAGVKIMQGVASAASLPWPANLAAMANVVAATASIISNIQSIRLEFAGERAEGGPVSSGKAFLVGERGPELFVPSSAGNIVPNDDLGRGVKVVINNYTDARPEVTEREQDGERIIEVVIRRVKNELGSEVRDGRGDFNRALEGTFGLRRGRK